MPIGLGNLTCLRKLSDFVVADDEEDAKECSSRAGSRSGKGMLNELNGLNQLRGKIEIKRLEKVKNAGLEAMEVNLKEKKYLQSLILNWRPYCAEMTELMVEKSELLLEKLEPHPNLQELDVNCFPGVSFSSWLPNITNMVEIRLSYCVKLRHLPALHQLSSLKTLHLYELEALEHVSADDRPSPSQSAFFPSLQDIQIEDCKNLKGWWRSGVENEMPQFARLSRLYMKTCENVTWMMATSSSFKFLSLRDIHNLKSLSEEWLQNLTSLEELEIYDCPVLASISQGMRHLTCLQNLSISLCNELTIDGDDENGMEWGGLRSLQSLSFERLPKMRSLPMGLPFATSLQRLKLISCPNLRSLPRRMQQLTSLQELKIKNCEDLIGRCIKESGTDWPKIDHVPYVCLEIQRRGETVMREIYQKV